MSRRPPRAPPRAPLLLLGVLLASARANAAPAACAALERLPGLCAPRASGDPPPPLAAPNGAAPWPRAADACCEALRALDDAACFCRPAFLALPPRRRSAFVPALARAPGRCGVTPSLTPERCAARARRGAASGADDASGIETETTPPRAVTILQARELAGSEPTRVSPPPLSPTQPRVLPPAPATPAREDSPGAPSPRVPPPPFRTPPPPGNNDRALDETVRCDAETVQKLVLDGCASALNASRESSPGTGTPGTAARARACCGSLAALDRARCFCREDVANDVLLASPASFRVMFLAAAEFCPLVVRGGWRCAPFPAAALERSERGEEDRRVVDFGREKETPVLVYPPYPSLPSLPPSPRSVAEGLPPSPLCAPEAILAAVEACAGLPLSSAADPSARASICCEQLDLLDRERCLCDPALASVTRQVRFALEPALAAAPSACGFFLRADFGGDGDGEVGDGEVGDGDGSVVPGDTFVVPASPLASSPSPAVSPDTCAFVPAGLPPAPPMSPAPPMPPRPPRAPPSPAGPRGPPGPPGRSGGFFFSGEGSGFGSGAGGFWKRNHRVDDERWGRGLGAALFRDWALPPWRRGG